MAFPGSWEKRACGHLTAESSLALTKAKIKCVMSALFSHAVR